MVSVEMFRPQIKNPSCKIQMFVLSVATSFIFLFLEKLLHYPIYKISSSIKLNRQIIQFLHCCKNIYSTLDQQHLC